MEIRKGEKEDTERAVEIRKGEKERERESGFGVVKKRDKTESGFNESFQLDDEIFFFFSNFKLVRY